MRRAAKGALLAAMVAIGASAPLHAIAQPEAGKPAPTAAAPKADPKGANDAKDKDAKDTKDGGGKGEGALPPGHPRVDEGLPPGHPQVGGGAGQRPHGQGETGFFNPPEDTADDDPSLPPGALSVTVQDAEGKPIPGAPIRLDILHSSVAKGESRERRDAAADSGGSARFDGLPTGSGTSYRVTTTRGPAVYSIPPFLLGDKAGKRAVVHSYEAATDIDDAFIGMQGLVYLQLREDSIQVEQLFNVFNLGPVAWVPDVTVALPEGFKAFNKTDEGDEMRFEGAGSAGVALRGTVAPGRHGANFRYQVPFNKEERQTLRIELPPRVAQVRVIAEASKTMSLAVDGFPPAQRTVGNDGKKILITEMRAQRSTGGVPEVVITLSGLPTPSPWRWAALGIAGVVVIAAVGSTMQRREDGPPELDEDARGELTEARDALLDELVELERARKRGDVGPKTYGRVRAALLDALARIVAMIEDAPRAAAAKKKAGGAPQGPSKGGAREGARAGDGRERARGKARERARAPRS